jgi:hypothetical protein
MHSPFRAHSAVLERQLTPWVRQLVSWVGVFVLAILVQGCTAQPPATSAVGRDPANPAVRAKAVTYRSDIAPYESRRPVEPKPWTEQNQQVVPTPQP